MSRKLPGARDPPAILTQQVPEEEDLLPGPSTSTASRRVNRFANLNEEEEEQKTSKSDDEKSESDGATKTGAKPKVIKSSKRKKKRGKENRIPDNSNDQDIDKISKQIIDQYGNLEIPTTSEKKIRNYFTVTRKTLNYITELTKIYGWDTLDEDVDTSYYRWTRLGSILCHYIDKWPSRKLNIGLGMKFIKKENGKSYFCYTHSETFGYNMRLAMNRMNYDSLLGGFLYLPYILEMMQYHYDYPEQRNLRFLRWIIEKALIILETHFHDQFNITAGTCYLEFKYQTNRILYGVLFKKMLRCDRFLCFRSALEYAKLIRNLDPVDHLGLIHIFDIYAIRCHEYQWYIDAMADSIGFPNVAFSIPLALYHLEKKEDTTKSSELLLAAICHFPELAYCIVDRLPNRYKNEEVKRFFRKFYDKLQLSTLKTTCLIYSAFAHFLWGDVDKWFVQILEKAYEILQSPERLQEQFNLSIKSYASSDIRLLDKFSVNSLRFCILYEDFREHAFEYPIAKFSTAFGLGLTDIWWDPFPEYPVHYRRIKQQRR